MAFAVVVGQAKDVPIIWIGLALGFSLLRGKDNFLLRSCEPRSEPPYPKVHKRVVVVGIPHGVEDTLFFILS